MNLEPLATFHVELDPVLDLGDSQWGRRRVINVVGGSFEGPRLSGTVLPGGADWQVLHADGMASIDTRYTLRTHDGAHLFISTNGVRHGQPSVLERLSRGEPVDPGEYYFRLFCRFETGDERYLWLNRTLAVASAARTSDAVRYDAYILT
ncbi:DUF3237 domain-containing protein [Streptosporangium sp. NBC_01755]|uniref:DUF3237 domain-containing protein n=1 Tax=unclassified Streptosporangium TaxID=2632669 RepID=UPI002DDAB675|nr:MULTISPECIES: DUF3237 domain-containing protein [unclassified Streptosporangium]WSA25518.1 DUF3237 domain-containing protein [Streptosporangium sp. NBC_01810]WSD03094.1 DUF3237 domain-containing protein [Streptosporangium sp. NBC_01755]